MQVSLERLHRKKSAMEMDFNKILSAIEGHMLYLYASDVNKYDIHSSLLSQETVYISDDDPRKIEKELPGVVIVKPEKLKGVKASRIIFDGDSIKGDRLKHESELSKLKAAVICTYPLVSFSKKDLKKFVSCHTNMVLVTDSTTLLSSKKLENISLSEENIEKWVKKNLETIVLALLIRKPMSGKDIIKAIHSNLNVLVSPGRVYPLLQDLNQKGLLVFEYSIRDKVYKPVEPVAIEKMIGEDLNAGQLVLNKFSAME